MTRKASFSQPSNSRLECINQGFQYTCTKLAIYRLISKVFDPLKIFQQLTQFEVLTINITIVHITSALRGGVQKGRRCIRQLFRFTPRIADRCQHVKIPTPFPMMWANNYCGAASKLITCCRDLQQKLQSFLAPRCSNLTLVLIVAPLLN